jgi:prevent-host-death family protein
MDDTVSMRELNQKTSEVVRKVATTRHALTITSSGKPVGVQLVPIGRGQGVLDQLVASGRAVAPTVHGPAVAPPARGDTAVNVAEALAADRDEERW